MAMISSSDEFSLLLNKWNSESKELFMIGVVKEDDQAAYCVLVVIGRIVELDEEHLCILSDSGASGIIRYRGRQCVYEEKFRAPAGHLANRTFEDVFVFDVPRTSFSIAIGATSLASESSD